MEGESWEEGVRGALHLALGSHILCIWCPREEQEVCVILACGNHSLCTKAAVVTGSCSPYMASLEMQWVLVYRKRLVLDHSLLGLWRCTQ